MNKMFKQEICNTVSHQCKTGRNNKSCGKSLYKTKRQYQNSNTNKHTCKYFFCSSSCQPSSKLNSSSIFNPNILANSYASKTDGLYCPFSNEIIVLDETLTKSASCCWVSCFFNRYSFILFESSAGTSFFTFYLLKYEINFT